MKPSYLILFGPSTHERGITCVDVIGDASDCLSAITVSNSLALNFRFFFALVHANTRAARLLFNNLDLGPANIVALANDLSARLL